MSLSVLLKQSEAQRLLVDIVRIPPGIERFFGDMLVTPQSECKTLVGTAFDYLMRFRIEEANPSARSKPWVADAASTRYPPKNPDTMRISDTLGRCHLEHKRYIQSARVTDGLLLAAFELAQLDHFVRSKAARFVPMESCDALHELAELNRVIPIDRFHAQNRCVLNPSFGAGSLLVGGADADLLIDETLIEVKTTTARYASRTVFQQLVAYAVLSRIGGVDGELGDASIRKIGIYSARHGYYQTWPIANIIDPDRYSQLSAWIVARGNS